MPSIKLHNKEKDQIYTLSTPDTNDATTITFPKISGSLALEAEEVNQTITIGEKYKTVTEAINYIQRNQVCNYTIVVPENYNWEKINLNRINVAIVITSGNKNTIMSFDTQDDFINKSNFLWFNTNFGTDIHSRTLFKIDSCSNVQFINFKITVDLKNLNVNNHYIYLFYVVWSNTFKFLNSTISLVNHANSTGTGKYTNKRIKLKSDYSQNDGIMGYTCLGCECINTLFVGNSNITGWDQGLVVLNSNLYINTNTFNCGNYVISATRQSKVFIYRTNIFVLNDDTRYQCVYEVLSEGTYVTEGYWGTSTYTFSTNGTSSILTKESTTTNKITTDNASISLHKLTI